MCGLAGICGRVNFDSLSVVNKMTNLLTHRGPDNINIYSDNQLPMKIGHSRLSIIDLSKLGNQPMTTTSGKYTIAYNGEIYNHNELRELILSKKKVVFKGTSDTEILLYAFEIIGINNTLNFIKGMFSIFLFDHFNNKIFLINDIFGEKPLYFSLQSGVLCFASELKSLKIIPNLNLTISKEASSIFFQRNSIPSPLSIYNEVNKIEPGTIIEFNFDKRGEIVNLVSQKNYHKHDDIFNYIKSKPFSGSYSDAKNKLKYKIEEAVKKTTIADCKVGSFLSGGIDSTLITSILSSFNGGNFKTFSIGFDDSEFNEANQSKKIAKYLNTDHNEFYITSSDVLDIVEKIPDIYCEPFSDSSQIPTYFLCNMATNHVKVALTGDGGDEIFAGYNRYVKIAYLWKKLEKIPFLLRKIFIELISLIPLNIWNSLYEFFTTILRSKHKIKYFTEKIERLLHSLACSSSKDFYLKFISHWDLNKENILINNNKNYHHVYKWFESDYFEHTMMAVDTKNYLPSDLLVKTDRAAMANSLETRMPFLYPDVYKFAWSLPINYKISNGESKFILKDILADYLPKHLFDKPKMGFLIPISKWLKNDLKDWACDILDKKNFQNNSIINHSEALKNWNNFLSGKPVSPYKIWDILIFQQWLNKNF